MYQPKYKPNQVICGSGQVAVVTGWTPRQFIEKKLTFEYAAIGNLYSATRGISFLIRNLLYNPQVRYLVILDATREDENSGAVECLWDFFTDGVTLGKTDTLRESWVINSTITGYIDKEIPLGVLDQLRENIQPARINHIDNISLLKFPPLPAWGEPLVFPEPEEVITTTLPGPVYGHRVEGKTVAQTWVKLLQRIRTTGVIRPTGYDGKWQELIDLVAIVTDEPEGFYFPEPNYLPLDREFLDKYIPQILEDAPYQEGVKYTYGQRLRSWFGKDQIDQCIEKLIKEIDAASAVMSLWDVEDHIKGGSPCLNHIWLRVVENKLSLTAIFRSNDMFAAWPANAMGLRALQLHIRDEINSRSDIHLHLGPLITISQSAHIYDDTWENVDGLLNNQYDKLVKKITYDDPCGNFLIEVDQHIIVKQTTIGSGEEVAIYSNSNPLKLIREIAAANPAIQPQHIGYLGIELEKASLALRNNQQYTQP